SHGPLGEVLATTSIYFRQRIVDDFDGGRRFFGKVRGRGFVVAAFLAKTRVRLWSHASANATYWLDDGPHPLLFLLRVGQECRSYTRRSEFVIAYLLGMARIGMARIGTTNRACVMDRELDPTAFEFGGIFG